MNKPINIPFYLKISQIIVGFIGFFFILYIGAEIILPLIFATILAILLNPVVNYLNSKRVPRVIAIFIVVILALGVISGLIYFIVSQATLFFDTLPILREKFSMFLGQATIWVAERFNISVVKVREWITSVRLDLARSGSGFIGQTLITISNFLIVIFLIPVYIIMILYYKPLLLQFIKKLMVNSDQDMVADILFESKSLIQKYLIGLVAEMLIMAVMNSVGLLALGVPYAILLAIIGAIINVIPYIGGIVGTLLPMIIALSTKSPVSALYVLITFSIIQFIDNHYIVPYIVASRVKLNALVSIVVVLVGAALWGVPGMFLSIPLTAIIKVMFDRIEPLKPWGFLLGDTMPTLRRSLFVFKKKKDPPI